MNLHIADYICRKLFQESILANCCLLSEVKSIIKLLSKELTLYTGLHVDSYFYPGMQRQSCPFQFLVHWQISSTIFSPNFVLLKFPLCSCCSQSPLDLNPQVDLKLGLNPQLVKKLDWNPQLRLGRQNQIYISCHGSPQEGAGLSKKRRWWRRGTPSSYWSWTVPGNLLDMWGAL